MRVNISLNSSDLELIDRAAKLAGMSRSAFMVKAAEEKATAPVGSAVDGWKEATIAWAVCASIHREFARGRDPLFTTRQTDFVKHENDARARATPPNGGGQP